MRLLQLYVTPLFIITRNVLFFMSGTVLWMYHHNFAMYHHNFLVGFVSQWWREIGIFDNCWFFKILQFYSSKLFLIFPCHIVFLMIIVLHFLLSGISRLTSLTKLCFCIYKIPCVFWI